LLHPVELPEGLVRATGAGPPPHAGVPRARRPWQVQGTGSGSGEAGRIDWAASNTSAAGDKGLCEPDVGTTGVPVDATRDIPEPIPTRAVSRREPTTARAEPYAPARDEPPRRPTNGRPSSPPVAVRSLRPVTGEDPVHGERSVASRWAPTLISRDELVGPVFLRDSLSDPDRTAGMGGRFDRAGVRCMLRRTRRVRGTGGPRASPPPIRRRRMLGGSQVNRRRPFAMTIRLSAHRTMATAPMS
jgi:hypothetical protein